jgi:hypothetical protein
MVGTQYGVSTVKDFNFTVNSDVITVETGKRRCGGKYSFIATSQYLNNPPIPIRE